MQKAVKIIIMEPSELFSYSLVGFIKEYYPKEIQIVTVRRSLSELRRDIMTQQFDAIITDLYGANENIASWREFYSVFSMKWQNKGCLLWTSYNIKYFSEPGKNFKAPSAINKSSTLTELHGIINKIIDGNLKLDHDIRIKRPHELSLYESEVILRYMHGESLTDIAVALKRSIKTISSHKRAAMCKLRVSNNKELLLLNRSVYMSMLTG